MKKLSVLTAALLAATAFSAIAADKQVVAKAPTLMTDAQMKKVVAGSHGPVAHGICTATFKAHAPGAIKWFDLAGNFGGPQNLPGTGNLNSKGKEPGFGNYTAGKSVERCPLG